MNDEVRRARRLDRRHHRIRVRGASPLLLACVRAVLTPLLRVYFRVQLRGVEHVPVDGPVILTPNHRSFLDPFVVALGTRRTVYFVAKSELFSGRLQGWLLCALGAFPIRRGEQDAEAMETARRVLRRGDVLLIFPEGTRVRRGPLRAPRSGMARLALQTGATVVPVALSGTEHARRGWKIRPVKVQVRYCPPVTVACQPEPDPVTVRHLKAGVWAQVQRAWVDELGGPPPVSVDVRAADRPVKV